MTDHSRSAFCRSAAQRLIRARLLESEFHRIGAGRPLSLIGSSCRYCRFALLFLSQLTSPRAFLCTSHSDAVRFDRETSRIPPLRSWSSSGATALSACGREPHRHRSVASSGLHRSLRLLLFCQGIYASSGLWSIAHACCIAARHPILGNIPRLTDTPTASLAAGLSPSSPSQRNHTNQPRI